MKTRYVASGLLCGAGFLLASFASNVSFAETSPYAAMAPLSSYLEASDADEIALARSAAPESISAKADVLTLSKDGYKVTIKGTNGFVCVVERSWTASFADAEFWNPKFRAPTCYNRAGARSVLAHYLERTAWVLAGVSRAEMLARTRAELSGGTFTLPDAGAMAYMLSKQTHLHDADGHWHPHLMFFLVNAQPAAWGANLEGSPVFADDSTIFGQEGISEPVTTFFVPVKKWSDSTSEEPARH